MYPEARGASSAQLGGAIAPKQSAMSEHANKLHEQATRLAEINTRISSLLGRLHGPSPAGTTGESKPREAPSGTLYVAQFGAERISLEIDMLHSAVVQLEQLA